MPPSCTLVQWIYKDGISRLTCISCKKVLAEIASPDVRKDVFYLDWGTLKADLKRLNEKRDKDAVSTEDVRA